MDGLYGPCRLQTAGRRLAELEEIILQYLFVFFLPQVS